VSRCKTIRIVKILCVIFEKENVQYEYRWFHADLGSVMYNAVKSVRRQYSDDWNYKRRWKCAVLFVNEIKNALNS
jgi:hypothetical protein